MTNYSRREKELKRLMLSHLGRQLYKARMHASATRERGVSQSEAGGMLGVEGQTLGKWEKGKQEPSILALVNLAAFYGMHPCDMIFGDWVKDVTVLSPPVTRASDSSDEREALRAASEQGARKIQQHVAKTQRRKRQG